MPTLFPSIVTNRSLPVGRVPSATRSARSICWLDRANHL
jgi:hypothetical protein